MANISTVLIVRFFLVFIAVLLISACAKKAPPASTSPNSATAAEDTTTPNKMTASKLWNRMGKRLTFIQEGHHGPIIYDFTDTNCPYCHLIYVTEADLIREGKLTVRYVPVAIIKPSSMPEAAAILQEGNPIAALQHAEQEIGNSMTSGKPANLPQATDAIGAATQKTITAIKKIEENNKFLQEIDVNELPDIIYLPKKGKLGLITGFVSQKQLLALLPELQQ
ncbi:thioredoxin fold domain-containing protein [Acidithiobacillus ferriphilus]|uniref:thioredoxin fold domain-containing protein n=1 Tax=Acidithiobacillus ferriphilus TaxID=1689834 RepID=UPI003F5131CF